MPEALEEGWYTDPYERHEARWFSEGRATKLVRDRGVETYDDPPEGPPPGVAEKIVIDPPASLGPSDLLRADDAELEEFDQKKANRAALDAFDQSGGEIPLLREQDASGPHRPQ
jgi:hypothetical protein